MSTMNNDLGGAVSDVSGVDRGANAELAQQLSALTALAQQNELRVARLLRWNQRLLLGLSMGVALSVYAAVNVATSTPAQAGNAIAAVAQDAKAVDAGVKRDLEAARAGFDQNVERLRADLAAAKQVGGLKSLVVLMNDIKKALQAMPPMAANMETMAKDMHQMNGKMSAVPAMAAQMQQMNANVAVMTYGVNSTMGRMGRMMPW